MCSRRFPVATISDFLKKKKTFFILYVVVKTVVDVSFQKVRVTLDHR